MRNASIRDLYRKIAHSRDIGMSDKGTVVISYLTISFLKLLCRNSTDTGKKEKKIMHYVYY